MAEALMVGFLVVCVAIMTVCFLFLLLGATFLAITEIVADIKDNIERMIE